MEDNPNPEGIAVTQDEIIEMARQAGFFVKDSEAYSPSVQEDHELTPCLKAFAELVAAKEREVVANWIMDKGFATGHGDSIVDLLDQLQWQIEEKEREACAKLCEDIYYDPKENNGYDCYYTRPYLECAEAIRARGQA